MHILCFVIKSLNTFSLNKISMFDDDLMLMVVANFDNESSDEENDLEKVAVTNSYCTTFTEKTIFTMKDKQFQKYFRMNTGTFEDLFRKINDTSIYYNLDSQNKTDYPSLEQEVMITIWYLGNMESYRSVANRFRVTLLTCWDIIRRICNLLLKVNSHYKIISWPNRERQVEISNGFTSNGLTGIVGCIDCSHIQIMPPMMNPFSYANRKGYYSLLLQAVCDNRMLFTDIQSGEAGSVHDNILYKKSELYRAIHMKDITFFNGYHLIGDLAYELNDNLIVGFQDNGYLTLRQKNFNMILSKIRVNIENAFALLKGRFRRLKFMDMGYSRQEDLPALNIMGACILHNICILNDDLLNNFIDIEAERKIELHNLPNVEELDQEDIDNNADNKRNNIVNSLPIIINQ